MIKSTCHSDDKCVEVEFDATPWFKQATDKDIVALAKCGWRNDYPSDAVAHYMADKNKEVAKMFIYIEIRNSSHIPDMHGGFECSVDEDMAMKWLQKHRVKLCRHIFEESAD